MTPPPDLQAYLRARREAIEAALARALPAPPACPAIIADAMRYSVLAGGKRLRPILTLAAAEAVADATSQLRDFSLRSRGPTPTRWRLAPLRSTPAAGASPESPIVMAMPAACAIEMIHTYSLIHDDLPAMDDDTMRRGRPTAHVVYGEGIAILAGDGLLTEAFGLVAREPAGDDPELTRRKLRTSARLAEAAGAIGMVGGQAIDLQGGALGGDELRAMHARKTGALIRAAAVAGAIMAGAPDPLVEAIDRYAAELGLAFQIVDDVLDVEGHAEELGKTAGKDAAAGKPTYPALYGLEGSRRLAARSVEAARAALAAAGLAGRLPEIAEWVVGRTS